jgi:putative tryptophan/tyrosine transport system substrate-binding protein
MLCELRGARSPYARNQATILTTHNLGKCAPAAVPLFVPLFLTAQIGKTTMRRREFITFLGGAVATWPLAARAQQSAKLPVIGFLSGQSPDAIAPYVEAFRAGLADVGFVDGQNVAIEYRWARGHYDLLPTLAAELIARNPVVIAATGGDQAISTAKSITQSIPLVFLVGGDPVQLGLVASFNHPGGTITGITMLTNLLDAKRLGLLRQTLPQSKAFAFLENPNFPEAQNKVQRTKEAAEALGIEVVVLSASSEIEINDVMSNFDPRRLNGLLVVGDPFFNSRRDQIVALVTRIGVPAMYEWREYAAAGGLMSYGTNLPAAYRTVGAYAGRIAKGEKAADLPILQPTKFEFVINLKTAKALGLTIPPTLLATADEVIE